MNLDTLGQKLYFFIVLDPINGKDLEAESLLKSFVIKGFKQFNFFMFISDNDIVEINEFVEKNKSEGFIYFLIDMTNHVNKDVFKGYLTPKIHPFAPQMAELVKQFRTPETSKELSKEDRLNTILEKVGKLGREALTKEEQEFLKGI